MLKVLNLYAGIGGNRKLWPDDVDVTAVLYQEIILLQKQFKNGKFVIENVIPYYDPLIKPTAKLARHYFWTNFDVPEKDFPKLYDGRLHNSVVADLEKAYGIFLPDWAVGKRLLLRNVCRPDVGKYLYDLAKVSDGKIS